MHVHSGFILILVLLASITENSLSLDYYHNIHQVISKRFLKVILSSSMLYSPVMQSTISSSYIPSIIQVAVADDSDIYGTIILEDSEQQSIYRRAKQLENDGEYEESRNLYEQILEVNPRFIYAWSSLGNVLTATGSLDDALLCYRKSLSLKPPKEEAVVVLINKASIELSLGKNEACLRDLDLAEVFGGQNNMLLPLRGVVYSNLGQWQQSVDSFSKAVQG